MPTGKICGLIVVPGKTKGGTKAKAAAAADAAGAWKTPMTKAASWGDNTSVRGWEGVEAVVAVTVTMGWRESICFVLQLLERVGNWGREGCVLVCGTPVLQHAAGEGFACY